MNSIRFGSKMRLHFTSSAICGRGSNRDLNLRFRRIRTLHVTANAGIFPTALHVQRGCRARPKEEIPFPRNRILTLNPNYTPRKGEDAD